MRKYVLAFFSLCIDYVWINAAVALVERLFPDVVATILGQPTSWAVRQLGTLVLLSLLRVANASLGEWMTSYALAERPAGQRQWPNLLLGTLGFVSAISYLFRFIEDGNGMPFMLMVEDTPLKIGAVALYSALFCWGGIMLVRFAPAAKLYNALMAISAVPLAALNQMFSHDALVASIIAGASNRGHPMTLEKAEVYARLSIYFSILVCAVVLACLYFCRERPADSPDSAPAGAPQPP